MLRRVARQDLKISALFKPSVEIGRTQTRRMPYPMSWEEQSILFAELPDHLHRMALYKVNSGSREQEVVKLRWDWEILIPELNTSVFLIPADFDGRHESSEVKNGDERLVVLNNVAKSVIEGPRGLDPVWVIPYGQHDRNGKATPVHQMNDSHGRKLESELRRTSRSASCARLHLDFLNPRSRPEAHIRSKTSGCWGNGGRQKGLLGHKDGSITSHYSAAELGKLIDEANRISATDSRGPALTILRRMAG